MRNSKKPFSVEELERVYPAPLLSAGQCSDNAHFRQRGQQGRPNNKITSQMSHRTPVDRGELIPGEEAARALEAGEATLAFLTHLRSTYGWSPRWLHC